MAKRQKYGSEIKFAKKVGVYLIGGAVGVLAEKAVNDLIAAGQLPNPQFSTVQLSDVAMITAELATAYYLKKKPNKKKKLAANLLVGMATGTVAAQAYEWGAQQGSWFALTRGAARAASMSSNYSNGRGKYNNTAPLTGKVGAYLNVVPMAYPRR